VSRKEFCFLVAGLIGGVNVIWSIYLCRKFRTIGEWWDSEGLPIWMASGLFMGGLIFGA
jgi:hypothetical protein